MYCSNLFTGFEVSLAKTFSSPAVTKKLENAISFIEIVDQMWFTYSRIREYLFLTTFFFPRNF